MESAKRFGQVEAFEPNHVLGNAMLHEDLKDAVPNLRGFYTLMDVKGYPLAVLRALRDVLPNVQGVINRAPGRRAERPT